MKTRQFGNTNIKVTCVGLGGEGVLRTHGRSDQAGEVIQTAIGQGIAYFDSARVYSDSECYYGSFWEKHADTRTGIFQASKSASRDRDHPSCQASFAASSAASRMFLVAV